jgi:hypothetical protein
MEPVHDPRRQPDRAPDRVAGALERLEQWGAARGWIGPDPYEGLNTPAARLAPGKRARQAVTQTYKRLPFTPPWPLRAPTAPNAKALALVLSGYATRAGRRLPGAGGYLDRIPRQLEGMNLLGDGAAWGYHFDVETRNISYDARTPNAIATSFAVAGLCDAHAATADSGARDLALRSRPFLKSLLAESPDHGPFFGYIQRDDVPLIHNANLLVCGALARLHALDPDPAAARIIEEAVSTTLACQRDDGLWGYGEEPNYRWVDNFHTAYVLDGLMRARSTFEISTDAFGRGLAAWKDRFFEPDGWARYFPDRHFPLETHSAASAIDLLAELRGDDEVRLAERIAGCSIRELWLDGPGWFAFRRSRGGVNRRGFMRWTNAPMFCALAKLASVRA